MRLNAYASNGAWYVGYGPGRTAYQGMTITRAEAESLLHEDARRFGQEVKAVVAPAMTQAEYSALVSLAYNLGTGAFARSRVVERLNAGDREGAADAFLHYDNAGGIEHKGLSERRKREQALFLSATQTED
jgi:lysozyme